MRAHFTLLSIAWLPLLACGGGGNNVDAGHGSGSGGHDGGGSGSSGCIAASAYTAAPTMATADDVANPGSGGSDVGDEFLDYEATLDATTDIEISLYSGTSDYPGGTVGPESGKSLASTDDSQFSSCGSCILLYAGVGSDGTAAEIYLATGGSLTVSSTTTNFTGTLTGVTFTHVTIDDQTEMSTAVGDGCTTGIASMSFTAPITIDTGSAAAFAPWHASNPQAGFVLGNRYRRF